MKILHQERQQVRGNVLTPQGWHSGSVLFDEHIIDVLGESVNPAMNEDDYILPGFVDLHVHGGGGKDTMQAGNAVHIIAQAHARHGTTSLLATTMTAPLAEIDTALAAIGEACKNRQPQSARILGAHLEGPYISAEKLGAQPAYACAATLSEVQRLAQLAPLR
ncbi:MAG: hypothetical protein RL748_1347, partial [Pseudomonadota bacterium]